jgi:hypothetical protein
MRGKFAVAAPVGSAATAGFHLAAPDEVIYDHPAAKHKISAGVVGVQGSVPCVPEYGDTRKHALGCVDGVPSRPGRFWGKQ